MPLRPIAGNAAQGIATLRALGHTVRPEDLPPSPETFIGPPKPPQVEPPKPSIAYYSIVGPEAVAEKKTFLASIKERLHGTKEWFIGEFLGDVGAVPATLLLQRYAPSVMTGIQHITEPVVGGLLRSRTRAAASRATRRKWWIVPNSSTPTKCATCRKWWCGQWHRASSITA